MSRQPPGDRIGHIVHSGIIDFGGRTAPSLHVRQEVIPRVISTVAGVDMLQVSRDDVLDHRSLSNAVFRVHRTLQDPQMLATPFVPRLSLFTREEEERLQALNALERDFHPHRILHHPVFQSVSQREFAIFNIVVDGGHIVVLTRLRSRHRHYDPAGREFFFRRVTDIAILDPRGNVDNANERRHFLAHALRDFLRQGSIELPPATTVHNMEVPECGNNLNLTGYWCFGITCELIRRLNIIATGRIRQGYDATALRDAPDPAGLWADIHETWSVDTLRENMLASASLRAIQQSDYHLYIGLVVPSDTRRAALPSLRPPQVLQERVPDEDFPGYDNEGPPLAVPFPGQEDDMPPELDDEPPPPYEHHRPPSPGGDGSGGSDISMPEDRPPSPDDHHGPPRRGGDGSGGSDISMRGDGSGRSDISMRSGRSGRSDISMRSGGSRRSDISMPDQPLSPDDHHGPPRRDGDGSGGSDISMPDADDHDGHPPPPASSGGRHPGHGNGNAARVRGGGGPVHRNSQRRNLRHSPFPESRRSMRASTEAQRGRSRPQPPEAGPSSRGSRGAGLRASVAVDDEEE
ncbi:hypothetical protein F4780DRAFT_543435 [Xylariomycetidae sp. FL0641]|nr:hypothetical protein F4780DRAFT_543435 [Xylariomycetidae sp. FL0641]